jgi:hypothetical protein
MNQKMHELAATDRQRFGAQRCLRWLAHQIGAGLIGAIALASDQSVIAQSLQNRDDALKPPYELWRELRPGVESRGERENTATRMFLRPLNGLRAHLDTYLASSKWRSDFCQFYGNELSFMGRDREAIFYFDKVFPNDEYRSTDFAKFYPQGHVRPADLAGLGPEDAVAVITALAAQRKVVMINEAHDVAQHRMTTLLLLESLKREGYTYFAAETLYEQDESLQARGYPTIKTGFYTREPIHGELVRTALRLGYRVVPYEHKPAPGEKPDATTRLVEREEFQARNLRDRIFARDPMAKVLIHAGYGHISKLPTDWKKDDGTVIVVTLMAGWFAKLTGIDPLVIDQTVLMEHSEPRHDHPVYRAAIEKGWLKGERPIVLRHAETKATFVTPEDKGRYDLVVLHPPVKDEQARPAWLRLLGRRPVVVPNAPTPPKGTMLLLQAFYTKEDIEQAIPADQIAYGPDEPTPPLMLPTGSFRTRAVDAEGNIHFEREVTVE